jgi:hypothetical protein
MLTARDTKVSNARFNGAMGSDCHSTHPGFSNEYPLILTLLLRYLGARDMESLYLYIYIYIYIYLFVDGISRPYIQKPNLN